MTTKKIIRLEHLEGVAAERMGVAHRDDITTIITLIDPSTKQPTSAIIGGAHVTRDEGETEETFRARLTWMAETPALDRIKAKIAAIRAASQLES